MTFYRLSGKLTKRHVSQRVGFHHRIRQGEPGLSVPWCCQLCSKNWVDSWACRTARVNQPSNFVQIHKRPHCICCCALQTCKVAHTQLAASECIVSKTVERKNEKWQCFSWNFRHSPGRIHGILFWKMLWTHVYCFIPPSVSWWLCLGLSEQVTYVVSSVCLITSHIVDDSSPLMLMMKT